MTRFTVLFRDEDMKTSLYNAENDIHISRCCIQSIHVWQPVQIYDVAKFGVSTDDIASWTLFYTL